jgi:hypothetical protein
MKKLLILAVLLVASPALAAITVTPDHVVARESGSSQVVYFTITDDGTAYKWHGVTPVLEGAPLQSYLNGKRREFMCGIFRKIYRDVVVEDKPDKDCYADWKDWIDAGHKNVTSTTVGLSKSDWKDAWRTANTVLVEKTKAQATNKIQVDVDDPADAGTEVIVGYQLDDNGDGTVTEIKTRTKRKIKANKLQLKDGCQFKPADGKFYCFDRPSAEAAEAAATAPGGWTPPVTQTTETVIPAKPFKATW